VAWARVLGIQEAGIDLVAHGYSQAEAARLAHSAGFAAAMCDLSDEPVVMHLPTEWDQAPVAGD
jgi:hypothetical protein